MVLWWGLGLSHDGRTEGVNIEMKVLKAYVRQAGIALPRHRILREWPHHRKCARAVRGSVADMIRRAMGTK